MKYYSYKGPHGRTTCSPAWDLYLYIYIYIERERERERGLHLIA